MNLSKNMYSLLRITQNGMFWELGEIDPDLPNLVNREMEGIEDFSKQIDRTVIAELREEGY